MGYARGVAEMIAQRQLRNDNAEIMRRVEAGESFVITRNGRPVADLVPHGAPAGAPTRRKTAGELQEELRRTGPHPDADRWRADLAAEDALWPDDRDW
jgi:prevent-host-death family protein